MKNILTATIGIPAHNEEKGIGKLLDMILSQKSHSYILEKIVVRCDGCTDNTSDIVRAYAKCDSRIYVIDDGTRLGLSAGLNQLFGLNKSDVFIVLDADCTIENNMVIEKIMLQFKDPKVGLVSGNALPHAGKNFIEKLAATWIMFWYEARKDYMNGDTVTNHFGCISAMSRDLTRQVRVPAQIVGSPDYIYFMAKRFGFEYRFVKNAKVYYHVASNLQEYLKQTARHHASKNPIIDIFGDEVLPSYDIPAKLKRRALMKMFFKEPILFPAACLLQIILRISQKKLEEKNTNGLWTMINSTK